MKRKRSKGRCTGVPATKEGGGMSTSREAKDAQAHNEESVHEQTENPPEREEQTPAKGEEKPKPRWQRFLESSGGTALITVIIGGIFGQWITASFQQNEKEREFQQAWMKSRGDQALVSYKEYLDQEQEVMKRAYELIGNSIAASQDLIAQTGKDFNPEQQIEIQKKFNEVSVAWRSERTKLELLIGYYHPEQPQMLRDWQNLSEAVSVFVGCASRWNNSWDDEWRKTGRSPSQEEIHEACGNEKRLLDEYVAKLNSTHGSNRRYAWEGWNTPAELRNALESKTISTSSP